jgi:uncharacterized protein YwqG
VSISLLVVLSIALLAGILLIRFNSVSNPATDYKKMLSVTKFDNEEIITKEVLKNRMEKVRLWDYWSDFEQFIKQETIIKTEPTDDNMSPFCSRLGGHPCINANILPNENLIFIAQINCEEVHNVQSMSELPKNGMLYFFADAQKIESGNNFVVVIYSLDYQSFTIDTNVATLPDVSLCRLDFSASVSLPPCEDPRITNIIKDYQSAGYFKAVNTYNCHKIEGYPDTISQNVLLDEQILLLQLDTDEQINLLWGEMGRLFVTIDRQKLKNADFSTIFSCIQSYCESSE